MAAPGPARARHLAVRGWGLAASLAVLAGVLVVGGILAGGPSRQPSPVAPETSPPAAVGTGAGGGAGAERGVPTTTEPPVAAPSDRMSISIPSIAVTSDLIGLGIEEDRTVEVPQAGDQAGWYELGTVPGQPGSAVVLGHVDSSEGPAVFYRLRELVAGAQVHVTLAGGAVETFEVTRIETIGNDDFPAQRVYAGTPGRPTLALVTCGGDYDAGNGGYQSNVIAFTEHVSTTPPG